MKRAWLLALNILLLTGVLAAQKFGNEWINPNQRYLKIPITSEGIYKIDFQVLNAASGKVGINLNAQNPQNLQVFAMGNQQPIWVEGQQDGKFDSTDYVLFYGKPQNADLDKQLYIKPEYQLNPYYSLVNDTTWYYITWSSSGFGKRFNQSNNNGFAAKTSPNYLNRISITSHGYYYNEAEKDNAGVSSSLYQSGEGWLGYSWNNSLVRSLTVYTPNAATTASAPSAKVKTVTVGTSNARSNGKANHGLIISYGSGNVVVDTTYTGYQMIPHQFEIPSTQMTLNTVFKYSKKPLVPEPPSDHQAYAYATVNYAHKMELSGESFARFNLAQNIDSTYLHFTAGASGFYDYAFDLESETMCKTFISGNQLQVIIPPGTNNEVVFTKNINNVNTIEPAYSSQKGAGYLPDFSLVNTDSAFVIVSHKKLWNAANQYASYRFSSGYDVAVLDIDDLYECFAYGIKQHPLSIRNAMRYFMSKPNNKPAYLFLMGKSIKESYTRKSAANRALNLVPTIGMPAADNIFTAPLNNVSFEPEIPTGRLAAETDGVAAAYLNKVVEHEAQTAFTSPNVDQILWTKRGLHFAGGENSNEQAVFVHFLGVYESMWSSPKMGGQIKNFQRFASGSVQSQKFDSVKYFIDNGVSIITFFGHGSGGQLGINIGEPNDYTNQGKYPLFIANSCNVGDYHLPNGGKLSINESWVLTPNRGSIGFISTTSAGYTSSLDRWSNSFYEKLSSSMYGESFGNVMKSLIGQISGRDPFINRACMEMNLHGDPAIRMYPKEKPDFAIRSTDVIAPNFIGVDQAKLNLKYTVFNLGYGIDSTTIVPVHIIRTFPDGSDTTYVDSLKGINYLLRKSFNLGIANEKSVGENLFSIVIDPNNLIDEIYPFINNKTNQVKVNITSDDLVPIHPSNYSIQPNIGIPLTAYTANPKAPENTYQFEIDETDSYNSPNKKSGTVKAKGGVVQWNPQLTGVKDSAVFFWRCSPVPTDGSAPKWREYSYQYIPNKTGWSQYDFNQFKNNTYDRLIYDKPGQKFLLNTGKVNITAYNIGNPPITVSAFSAIKFSINGNQQGRVGICGARRSMLVAIIDNRTFESWETRYIDKQGVMHNPNNHFANRNDFTTRLCATPDKRFQFELSNPVAMDSMAILLNQIVPDSFYVLIMSGYNGHFQDTNYWKDRHYKAFENLGADSIRYLKDGVPYMFLAQKGKKSSAVEVIGATPKSSISLNENVPGSLIEGNMFSTVISNVTNHNVLDWMYSKPDLKDHIDLTLSGIDQSGNRAELYKITNNEYNVQPLPTKIPAITQFKELELKARFEDSLGGIPPQMNHWMIIGDEALELSLCPKNNLMFHNDTVTQGETVTLDMGIKNLSTAVMKDKYLVRYTLTDSRGQVVLREIKSENALGAKDSARLKYSISTNDLSGMYYLFLDANPEDTNWITEVSHINNLYSFQFYVNPDNINPLLDVTFDGVHILDGDIVSAKPEILITLRDENKYRPLNDTSFFKIFLEDPKGNQKPIYFTSNTDYEIEFDPGNSSDNKASIHYAPNLTTDGEYTLTVQAKDASNNQSGKNQYKVGFEVINRSTITQVLNYPNPFSTSTQFVFTLTGYKVPDYFRIQILTATGKVVREIDQAELGTIRIGRNITEYAWDGRDEFGDQLANGVYFYRVITKIEGEEIENRNTNADNYFKKGFGKMYLMR